jgi:4-hydroxy-L-threonine phosphate dehydrogenase PdxA
MSAKARIGITLGDLAGIGPEVVQKALASGKLDRRYDYEVLGPGRRAIENGAQRCLPRIAALVTRLIAQKSRPVAPSDRTVHPFSRTKKRDDACNDRLSRARHHARAAAQCPA